MRKVEKIKIIFNEYFYNSSFFWLLIDVRDENESYNTFMFFQKFQIYIEKNKINLHKNVIYSLKPFLKIAKKIKNYYDQGLNIEKNILRKKELKIMKKVLVIKYKHQLICIYPFDNEKYTYALNAFANRNFIKFLNNFIENWNKYQKEFSIQLNTDQLNRLNLKDYEKNDYIKYFTNYYDNLK